MLERHGQEERAASTGDWLFAAAMVLVLVLIVAMPFVIAGRLVVVAERILF